MKSPSTVPGSALNLSDLRTGGGEGEEMVGPLMACIKHIGVKIRTGSKYGGYGRGGIYGRDTKGVGWQGDKGR